MPKKLNSTLKNIGLSEKAVRVYLAALDLGEASVQQLSSQSKLIRTTIYYTIEELVNFGALMETRRDKKTYYMPEKPQALLRRVRENAHDLEEALPELENRIHSAYPKSRTYFLYGVAGFKQIWEKIFSTKEKEFDIITSSESFPSYVREKYIVDEIIRRKRELQIRSRQLITNSQYAKQIIAKDAKENRVSKLLEPGYRLPYTTIICHDFVAFISPRNENMLIVIESESFAKSQKTIFENLWNTLSHS